MNRTALAALLLLVLPAAGCGMGDIVDPVYEIDPEDYLVVMPFKDPDFPERWASPVGHETAARLTENLQREAEFNTRAYEDVLGLYQADDVNKLSPRDVAALTKADYVLVCDFEELELRDRMSVNIAQGKARVKVRLFQVERRSAEKEEKERAKNAELQQARRQAGMPDIPYDRGGRFLGEAERTLEIKFPSEFMAPGGEPFLEPFDIQQGLMLSVAKKVAKLYYAHPAEKIEVD